ncbi:SHOCT domain-containing protein [Dactylosporangium sp. NPDC050688]|uniref:SHOCT domain-containing protein n=1 Tax=Dactylosporangium sp. NPDC050688 TaxID=3157217 RepID=UPI0033D48573
MRLTMRAAASLLLGFTGIVVLGAGLNRLLDVGTCASGGPSVIARPCPEGTTLWSLLLPVGLVIWMAGLLLSEGGLVRPGTGQVVWTAGFAGGGIALLVKVLNTPMDPNAKAGLYAVIALFIPLGLAFGVAGTVQLIRARRGDPRDPRNRPGGPPRARTPKAAAGDPHLKRLHRLRSMGALTREEFDRLKHDPATAADRLAVVQRLAELKASGVLTAEEFEAKKHATLHGEHR